MKNYSTKNTFGTSTGERLTSTQIEDRIRKTKQEIVNDRKPVCQECDHNGSFYPLDLAHKISVKWCKENGQAEKAYDPSNIDILCRKCHQKRDKLHLQFNTN